jgi:Flp pilus assembly protein TadG
LAPESAEGGQDRYEDGMLATELAIVMFVWLLGCVALVVFAGRVAQAEGDVQSAAQEAARAATLTGSPGQAQTVARDVAAANLTEAGVACTGTPQVQVDISDYTPGGYVTVTVICTANFADIVYLNVPGTRDFQSTATEIIDVYRSDNP